MLGRVAHSSSQRQVDLLGVLLGCVCAYACVWAEVHLRVPSSISLHLIVDKVSSPNLDLARLGGWPGPQNGLSLHLSSPVSHHVSRLEPVISTLLSHLPSPVLLKMLW